MTPAQLLLLSSLLVFIPEGIGGELALNKSQVYWLNQAYDEGQLYGIGRYFEAVVIVESSACMHKLGDDRSSLGCSQLKLSTARTVCRCRIKPAKLLRDNGANIRIGAQYLLQCFNRFWPDKERATVCFNRGPTKAAALTASQVRQDSYVAKVNHYLMLLKAIPESHD